MTDDSRRQSTANAGSHSQGSLEAAEAFLSGCVRSDGSDAVERDIDWQWQRLAAWAEGEGLILPARFPGPDRHGGAEHDVRHDESQRRWIKFTSPGFSGLTVDWQPGNEPALRMASPLEYLRRLILQNEVFADDIRLEGAWLDPDARDWRLVTSQRSIAGEAATTAQIESMMKDLGFEPLPFPGIGRPESLAFIRGEIEVWDAHPANIVADSIGIAVPIDLILTRSGARAPH